MQSIKRWLQVLKMFPKFLSKSITLINRMGYGAICFNQELGQLLDVPRIRKNGASFASLLLTLWILTSASGGVEVIVHFLSQFFAATRGAFRVALPILLINIDAAGGITKILYREALHVVPARERPGFHLTVATCSQNRVIGELCLLLLEDTFVIFFSR